MLMTGMFVAGAGVGALFSYTRDRSLLLLYRQLVEDLSHMVRHRPPDPTGPPAAAARVAEIPPLTDARQKCAS